MLLAFSNALIHSLQSERVNRSSNRQLSMRIRLTLLWRHNGRDSVSNHQPYDCLLNRLFRRRSRKHQSSASLAFVWGIHRGPVNSPHKRPVTRKMFLFDDVIMIISMVVFPTEIRYSGGALAHHSKCFKCYFTRWTFLKVQYIRDDSEKNNLRFHFLQHNGEHIQSTKKIINI